MAPDPNQQIQMNTDKASWSWIEGWGGGWISKGKGKTSHGEKGKGKAAADHDVLSSFPPYYQAARTHDRTETEIDFPVGLTPQPSILLWEMYAKQTKHMRKYDNNC